MADLSENLRLGFAGKRIAVIGDIVADQFLFGAISRVSREAPVFILKHEQTVTLPGAAANAAANVASLGGEPVLIGIAGNDRKGELLVDALRSAGVADDAVAIDPERGTTTKVRVVAGQQNATRQQVIRIDYDSGAEASDKVRGLLLEKISGEAENLDGIIISDYGCGAVFPAIYERARQIAQDRAIPLVVDSRFALESFAGATAATPNREEVQAILGAEFSDVDCQDLRSRLGYMALLVTQGSKGMTLFEAGAVPFHIDVVGSPEPVDVTGAGDTVIAAFALSLAAGLGFREATEVADHAGGIVVMKKGTATVTLAELLASLDETRRDLAAAPA